MVAPGIRTPFAYHLKEYFAVGDQPPVVAVSFDPMRAVPPIVGREVEVSTPRAIFAVGAERLEAEM